LPAAALRFTRVTSCAGWGAEVYVDVDHAPLGDVDLVFDLVGRETVRRSCAAVKAGGGVVSVVERPPVATGRDSA
jgi:NADPH:quinone reductase-like Zn-dependent oxidoreductase